MTERQFNFLHHYEQMRLTKSVLIYVAEIKKSHTVADGIQESDAYP
jgi:hypothetical protein